MFSERFSRTREWAGRIACWFLLEQFWHVTLGVSIFSATVITAVVVVAGRSVIWVLTGPVLRRLNQAIIGVTIVRWKDGK